MIQEEDLRALFDRQRKDFMQQNEDLDDSITNIPGGFATFSGPDRTDSLAHYKVAALVDAAAELERIPPEPPKVIPNEQADALFLLASLSSERSHELLVQKQEQYTLPPPQVTTPAQQIDIQRHMSPFAPLSTASTVMSLETGKSSPLRPTDVKDYLRQIAVPATPIVEIHGTPIKQEPLLVKSMTPSRASTNRIMDLLNDPQEVPTSKPRDAEPPIKNTSSSSKPAPAFVPARSEGLNQSQQAPQYGIIRMDALLHNERHDPYPRPKSAGVEEAPQRRSQSPVQKDQFWSSSNLRRPSEPLGLGDGRNPLDRIKLMLERKAERNRTQPRDDVSGRDGRSDPAMRRASIDRPGMAPPFSRPFSPSERPTTGRDSRKPSVSAYSPTPSNALLQYEQSPRDRQLSYNPQHHRQDSLDHGSRSQWEPNRRSSGSQAPPSQPSSQYADSPRQTYVPDFGGRPGPTPPARQSPYAPPSAPHLPPPSSTIPSKPSAPPTVYRFAHYDPAPPKAWPSQQPVTYAPPSQPPSTSAPPHPSQYPNPYPSQSQYQGYVPPPGSFQAPPPPPQLNASTPYPPLKIHQYGGQPILPANMAPPPPHSAPPYNQSPPTPVYSQPAHPPHSSPQLSRAPFEIPHAPGPPALVPPHERPDNGPRPRRPYRSYHAPGTEFRSYQGPNQRRRPT